MPRPRCSAFLAASLDGFIARPSGAIDWLSIVERTGEDYGFSRLLGGVDTMVLGRRTYETVLGFGGWPYGGKRCVVLTHHGPPSSRHGEEFASGDPRTLVDRLGEEGAARIYVDGGEVIAQFFACELLDDLVVSVVPVLLGEGIRFTRAFGRDVRLGLVSSRAFESGLVQLEYQVGSVAEPPAPQKPAQIAGI